MTMVPSMASKSISLRIASTATASDLCRSPCPIVDAHATAACSTTRRKSRERSESSIGSRKSYHYRRSARKAETLGGAATSNGDLQMIAAAKKCTHRPLAGFSISRDQRGHRMSASGDLRRPRLREAIERAAIDVRDEVAESIDAEHHAAQPLVLDARLGNVEQLPIGERRAKLAQLDALRQPRRRRREPVAAFERAADVRQRVLPLGQLHDPRRAHVPEHRGQQTVVGGDEFIAAPLGGDAAPRRSDAGVDDAQKHGARGKVFERRGEFERAAKDVLRRNLVRDVDERGVGTNAKRDAAHGADVMIARAEISQQRYYRAHWRSQAISGTGLRAGCSSAGTAR